MPLISSAPELDESVRAVTLPPKKRAYKNRPPRSPTRSGYF